MLNAVRSRGLAAPIALAATGAAVLAAVSDDGPTVCPFALGTGVACPGCGMTRALAALVRGDFAASWSFHPLATLALMEIAAAWTWWAWRRSGRTDRVPGRATQIALGLTAIALIAVWVVRLTTGTLPPV